MRIESSDLVVNKIWVHAGFFVTVYPDPPTTRSKPNFDIPLDADYEIHKTGRSYTLRLEIKTTEEEEHQDSLGYRFSVFTEAVFRISGRQSKAQKDYFIQYSALALLIAHIRGYLTNITSYGYYGQYILPAVDLNVLVAEHNKKTSLASKAEKRAIPQELETSKKGSR
ncbi:hypothetical protein ACFS7Z_19795 [Pontibacter toksunensis]|uniref:Preprotein translocase subunit SecB n=1 Tax=Pontibacter toksunensis TaxID=1332631 RepID=A0ABW6BXS2_9BACT